jgi:drug/metabolite transporter (DMT)-like permease
MPRIINYLSLIVAAVCFGSIPVFSYYLSAFGVPSLQQALFRILFTVLFLLIGIGVAFRFRGMKIRREHRLLFILYGLFAIACSIMAYITAIAIGTPVVIAVSLTYLYPAITLVLARFLLKEPLNPVRVAAVPLSVLGAVIVSLPINLELTAIPLLGVILSVANGVFAALYVVFGKWSDREGYKSTTTTSWGYTLALIWMCPLTFAANLVVTDPRIVGFQLSLPPTAWLLILGFALVSTTIPYTLVNVGLKHIDASAASIILLLDPISAVIMGYLFMHQTIAFWQLIGAVLILLASVLIALEQKIIPSSQNLI